MHRLVKTGSIKSYKRYRVPWYRRLEKGRMREERLNFPKPKKRGNMKILFEIKSLMSNIK